MLSIGLFAQQKTFPKDDQGKFIYYKVVDSLNLNRETLKKRAADFIEHYDKKLLKQTSETDSSILAQGKLIIDKTILVAGHPSGEVNYRFVFEVKNGKYRYWLTDFEFIPYKRDRYGNFVASTTVSTPLEKKVGKLNAGEWSAIQERTLAKAEKFGEAFKKYLATDALPKSKPEISGTISTKKW